MNISIAMRKSAAVVTAALLVATLLLTALLTLAGANRAANTASAQQQREILTEIIGTVHWNEEWMQMPRVTQLVEIYHVTLEEYQATRDARRGGTLIGEDVTDADGNYSIKIDIGKYQGDIHGGSIRFEIDRHKTNRLASIHTIREWGNPLYPYRVDMNWPEQWLYEESRYIGIDALRKEYVRAMLPAGPATPSPAATEAPGQEPEPEPAAAVTGTAGGREEDAVFRNPDQVYLMASRGTITSGADGTVELTASNPAGNGENLEVELELAVPDGLRVSSADGSYDAGTGRARYSVRPGQTVTVLLTVDAESSGRFKGNSEQVCGDVA